MSLAFDFFSNNLRPMRKDFYRDSLYANSRRRGWNFAEVSAVDVDEARNGWDSICQANFTFAMADRTNKPV